ncbi:hypothetical protein CR513_08475, partial [Mucuna pruriens]
MEESWEKIRIASVTSTELSATPPKTIEKLVQNGCLCRYVRRPIDRRGELQTEHTKGKSSGATAWDRSRSC